MQSLEKREKRPGRVWKKERRSHAARVPNMSVLSQQAVIQSPSSHANDAGKKKND